MRFFFRALALLSLSIAVISAVVDVARSLSASGLTLTSLQKGWGLVSPSSLAALEAFFLAWLPMFMSDPVLKFLLNMPAAAVFAALAALLYAVGAKRDQPFGQIRFQ